MRARLTAQAQTPRPSRVSRLCLGGNPVVGSRCLQFPGIHQVLVTSAPAHHHLPLISAQPSHPTSHCQARPASAPEHSVWFILLFEETDAACSSARQRATSPIIIIPMLSLRDRVWVRGPPVSPRQPHHGKALLHHGRCSYLKKKKMLYSSARSDRSTYILEGPGGSGSQMGLWRLSLTPTGEG